MEQRVIRNLADRLRRKMVSEGGGGLEVRGQEWERGSERDSFRLEAEWREAG